MGFTFSLYYYIYCLVVGNANEIENNLLRMNETLVGLKVTSVTLPKILRKKACKNKVNFFSKVSWGK